MASNNIRPEIVSLLDNLRILEKNFDSIDFSNVKYTVYDITLKNELNNIIAENIKKYGKITRAYNKSNNNFTESYCNFIININKIINNIIDINNVNEIVNKNINLELQLVMESKNDNNNNNDLTRYPIINYFIDNLQKIKEYIQTFINNNIISNNELRNEINKNNNKISSIKNKFNEGLINFKQILEMFENNFKEKYEHNSEEYSVDKLNNCDEKIKSLYKLISNYNNIDKNLLIFVLITLNSMIIDNENLNRKIRLINEQNNLNEIDKIRIEYNLIIGKEKFNEELDYISFGRNVLNNLDELWNSFCDDENYTQVVNEIHNIICKLYLIHFMDFNNYKNDTLKRQCAINSELFIKKFNEQNNVN